MVLTKKGVFFTFVAFIFLSLLIFSLSVGNNVRLRQKSFVLETRIDTMNRFVIDIEKDIQRGAYIAGFRSLVALQDQILNTGNYITDVPSDFESLFFNGTLNGTNSTFMQNNTFTDWMLKMKKEAQKIDLLVNFTVLDLTLLQDDPWEVRVDLDIQLDLADTQDISTWNKRKVIVTSIAIDNFEDPLYLIGTNGVVENRIVQSIVSPFVNGSNIANLLNHTYSGYYVAFSDAPSYLMRLQGNVSASPYGIESLVDIDELNTKSVPTQTKSIVDYIYFSSANPPYFSIQGAPSWFRLDNRLNTEGNQTHHDLYEVNGLVS